MTIVITSSRSLAADIVHRDFYIVSDETMEFDRKRRCWICGLRFEIGDGMSIAQTADGIKTIHTRCLDSQREDEHG